MIGNACAIWHSVWIYPTPTPPPLLTHTHAYMHTHTQGVVPTPEEAVVITRLTEEFFTELDPEEDDVTFVPAGKNLFTQLMFVQKSIWCIICNSIYTVIHVYRYTCMKEEV